MQELIELFENYSSAKSIYGDGSEEVAAAMNGLTEAFDEYVDARIRAVMKLRQQVPSSDRKEQ